MSYVIVSVVSLIVGEVIGVIMISLCSVAKNTEEDKNGCYGCFGASFGDCDHCPKNEGEKDEE